MSNRIDLTWLEGNIAAREERIENICGDYDYVENLLAELKRCYEKIDWLQQVADLAADNIGRKNWDGFEEAMYEAGLWERPSE